MVDIEPRENGLIALTKALAFWTGMEKFPCYEATALRSAMYKACGSLSYKVPYA